MQKRWRTEQFLTRIPVHGLSGTVAQCRAFVRLDLRPARYFAHRIRPLSNGARRHGPDRPVAHAVESIDELAIKRQIDVSVMGVEGVIVRADVELSNTS